MKSYTKVYFKYFGYSPGDFIACECGCGREAKDLHHLEPRSRRPDLLNNITNLIALTRECHDRAGRDREFNEELKLKHRKRLLANGLPDNETERYLSQNTNS